MNKFVDVNLIEGLRAVMETNTTDYKTDFNYDIKIMNRAAHSSDPQEKTVLWLSHYSGTECDTERNILIQKTDGNVGWIGFEGYTNERVLAYAAEIKGISDNGSIIGDLYEIDFYKHAAHVRADALPTNEDIMTFFFKDGYVNEVKMIDAAHLFLNSKDEINYTRYEPENPSAIEPLLRQEKEKREQSCVVGSFDEHIQRLKVGRITFEANQIAAKIEKMSEPNSSCKKSYIVPLSLHFKKNPLPKNLIALAKAIPYKGVRVCFLNDGKDLCAIVSAKAVTQSRKSSVLEQIEENKAEIAARDNIKTAPTLKKNEKEVIS